MRRQGIYWMVTLPEAEWTVPDAPPNDVSYLRGQLEQGEQTGYRHWQLLVILRKKGSLKTLQRIFGRRGNYELTRSAAADDYVWKEDTRAGEPFELGTRPLRQNEPTDWNRVWDAAKSRDYEAIPADVRVRYFGAITRISSQFVRGVSIERTIHVFWGKTGTGKSRRAWEEAGLEAYPKDPRTKWWDGYQGEQHVVMDEFRGSIDVAHLLRWFDRYPVLVEIKGGTVALRATSIWVTSNLDPREWYPDLDDETKAALLRRLKVIKFTM